MSHVELSTRYNSWLEIDLGALSRNTDAVCTKLAPGVALLAVVKANAYGHGLVRVSKAIRDRAHFFGVNSVEEAIALRKAGLENRILIFGPVPEARIPYCILHDLSLTVTSVQVASRISDAARRIGCEASIHIKIDTGMGRLGFVSERADTSLEKIQGLPGLNFEGIYTHFPQAEMAGDEFTRYQMNQFERVLAESELKGLHPRYRHAANSSGIVHFPGSHLNLVRSGLLLYGVYPAAGLRDVIEVTPVLSLKARIIYLKRVKAETSISYGRSYIAPRETVIATVPVGYGHGYPYQLSGNAEVLIHGKRYPVVGRVTMDYLMVDLGPESDCHVGDEVVLLGRDGADEIDASELAIRAQTIPYDIVTRLSQSVPRLYIRE